MSKRPADIREGVVFGGPAKSPRPVAYRARAALIVTSLLSLLLLLWGIWDQIHSRIARERELAAWLTASAAERLAQGIRAVDTRLVGFIAQERQLLDRLLAEPDAAHWRENLWSVLKLEFPPAAAALVLDPRGIEVAYLGEPPGDEDVAFLRRFARGDAPPVRFSKRSGNLYASVASSWLRDGTGRGAILLSLSCATLCPAETMAAPPGHSLHLLPGPTTTAAGNPGIRDLFGMLAALEKVPLGNTGWLLVDRLDEAYLAEILHGRLMLGLGLGVVLALAISALYRRVGTGDRGTRGESTEIHATGEKLQAILTAATDGILLTDHKGRIELINPAAEIMFGYLSEDVTDKNIFDLLPELFPSRSALPPPGQSNTTPAMPQITETKARRKGGKIFPVRLWSSTVSLGEQAHRLVVAQDLTEHERNERHLAFLQQHDVLTGLLNRREFEQRLTAILADPQYGAETPHVLCHIDVDRFKLINDTCGHEAGDALLKQLAILIKSKLGVAEIVGRFGGDEFLVLLRSRTAEEARAICDGLLQTIRNFLFTWRDQSFDIAVSIGLAEFRHESEGLSSALSKADVACHMAKTHGRDRVHIYHEGDAELIRHHGDMHLVATISQALSEGRFHLYAQPIEPITAATNLQRRHFEILVRMVARSGTAMIPDRFIPAAERYILMPALDRWIIKRLFSLQAENMRAWHRIEPDSFLFAVNLSGTSIAEEGFLRYLKRQFTEWDVPPRSICFELTETAAVSDIEHARAFMRELGDLGCSFALDDFGTGLSSYSYLKELPVDFLKIAGSFVRDMADDPVSHALVESITQIGHVLGMRIIAEWAEDQSTLMQLRTLNVDFAQGFAIGKPVPVTGLTLSDAAIPLTPKTPRLGIAETAVLSGESESSAGAPLPATSHPGGVSRLPNR